jgi:O-antigen ligase/tetratricopeptide (TPR) repeat protein
MTKAIFGLFIFILLFSPLAFGTVENWSFTVMETCSVLAFLLVLIGAARQKQDYFYETPGILPLLFFLIFILLQLVPLPQEIIEKVSPETYRLYKGTVLVVQPEAWMSLSINKKATLMEFFRTASYIIFYALTVQLLTKKEALKKTVAVVIVFASALSFFAILQHFVPNNKIYWARELTKGGAMFGPYVNRNHYAGLMEMLFPLILGLFLFYKPQVFRRSFREKVSALFNSHATNIYMLLGFSAVLTASSVFLTLSRSGIVSLCLSMVFFGMMFLSKGGSKKRAIIIIVVGTLIVISVGWFGWDPIFERFGTLKNAQGDISEMRLRIWKDGINIIGDFPLTGTGFGTFINIYPKYRTIPGNEIASHAHNDYIEFLSDGGAVACLIVLCFILVFTYKIFSAFRKRREVYSIYLFIASVTGILAIAMHSLTDFNLHIGANGLYLFFLLGLTVSAANTRMREGLNDTYLQKKRLPAKVLPALIGILLAAVFIFNAGVLAGDLFFMKIKDVKLRDDTTQQDLNNIKYAAYMAALCDPLEAKYHYTVANIERFLSNDQAALHHYTRAVELDPTGGEYLQRLGLILSELKPGEAGEELLRAGITYEVRITARYKRYALWLFSMGRKNDGIRIIRQAISLEPEKTREYITLMILNNLGDAEISGALPDRVEPHQLFADYLYRTGNERMAEEAYLSSLKYMGNEGRVLPLYFYRIRDYYFKKGGNEQALQIMRKAIEMLPGDAVVRIRTAETYEKLGKNDKAEEEYRKALSIAPANQEAKKRLDKLLSKNK